MLGTRIRRRRLELGLSQRQLAGSVVTREYISEIERGKRTPSEKVLHELAIRLQTSVSSLLNNSAEDAVTILINTSESLYESNIEKSLTIALEAHELARTSLNISMKFLVMFHVGMTYYKTREYYNAIDYFEDAIKIADESVNRQSVFRTILYTANAYYLLGEFSRAIRNYRRSIQYAEGYKTLQQDVIQATIYLGSSLFRMGNLEESICSYQDALHLARIGNHPNHIIDASLGLGWVLFQGSLVENALCITKKALTYSREHGRYSEVSLLHNLAIYNVTMRNYVTATHLFSECLEHYRNKNDKPNEIRVYEELCQIELHQQNIASATVFVNKSLNLLRDIENNDILSGRVYRLAGDLSAMYNRTNEANCYYELAVGYFKKCHATRELTKTIRCIDRCSEANKITSVQHPQLLY